MKTRLTFLLLAVLASSGAAAGQSQAPRTAHERLLYLRWEKWSPLQDEIAKRCLLVHSNGHYRFERTTEAMGGGGGEKAFEGDLSPEDLAAMKALITSPDFNHMKIPQSKGTGETRTIHNEAEMLPSFLATLAALDIPAQTHAHFLLITNNCTDDGATHRVINNVMSGPGNEGR